MPKFMHSMVKPAVVDLTNVTADYPLQVGETATLTYTSATSVPLRVATVEGIYELNIFGSTISTANNVNCYLLPNNTTYAANIPEWLLAAVDTAASASIATYDAFRVGSGSILHCSLTASTSKNNKSAKISSYSMHSANKLSRMSFSVMSDTTTDWSSFGTISFNLPQSGKIVIKRII